MKESYISLTKDAAKKFYELIGRGEEKMAEEFHFFGDVVSDGDRMFARVQIFEDTYIFYEIEI